MKQTKRNKPNILITGTPGVGKTTFAKLLADEFGMVHIPVSKLIKDEHLYTEYDEERDCTIYDDDLLDKRIGEIIAQNPNGGVIFDFHCSDILAEDDVDFVIVLRTTTDLLYKRLSERGYGPEKCKENVECEIFGVVLDDAESSFPDMEKDVNLIQLQSDTEENLNENVDIVRQMFNRFSN